MGKVDALGLVIICGAMLVTVYMFNNLPDGHEYCCLDEYDLCFRDLPVDCEEYLKSYEFQINISYVPKEIIPPHAA